MAPKHIARAKSAKDGENNSNKWALDPTKNFSEQALQRLKPEQRAIWEMKTRGETDSAMRKVWDKATGRTTQPKNNAKRLWDIQCRLDVLQDELNKEIALEPTTASDPPGNTSAGSQLTRSSKRSHNGEDDHVSESNKRHKSPNGDVSRTVADDGDDRSVNNDDSGHKINEQRSGSPLNKEAQPVPPSGVTHGNGGVQPDTGLAKETNDRQANANAETSNDNPQMFKRLFATKPTPQSTIDGPGSAAPEPSANEDSAPAQLTNPNATDQGDDTDYGVPWRGVHHDPWGRRTLHGYYALCPYSQYIPLEFSDMHDGYNISPGELKSALDQVSDNSFLALSNELAHHGRSMSLTTRRRIIRQIGTVLPSVLKLMTGTGIDETIDILLMSLDDRVNDVDPDGDIPVQACEFAHAVFWAYATLHILHCDMLADLEHPAAKASDILPTMYGFLAQKAEWEPAMQRCMWRECCAEFLTSAQFQQRILEKAEELTIGFERMISVLFANPRQTRFAEYERHQILEDFANILKVKLRMELSSIKWEISFPRIGDRIDEATMEVPKEYAFVSPGTIKANRESPLVIRYCPAPPVVKARLPLKHNKHGLEVWEIEERAAKQQANPQHAGSKMLPTDGFVAVEEAEVWYKPSVVWWRCSLPPAPSEPAGSTSKAPEKTEEGLTDLDLYYMPPSSSSESGE